MAGAKRKKGDGTGKSDGLFKYSISLQMQRESISKFEGSVDSGQRESTEVSTARSTSTEASSGFLTSSLYSKAVYSDSRSGGGDTSLSAEDQRLKDLLLAHINNPTSP